MDFPRGCSTSTDLKNFNPTKYFEAYHFYEEYDSQKDYNKNVFTTDFETGYGQLKYVYKLYQIYDSDPMSKQTVRYMVAEEELDEEEQKKLKPYCQCLFHEKSWYNPTKYLTCPCCVGCVGSPFPQQCVINQARKRMMEEK